MNKIILLFLSVTLAFSDKCIVDRVVDGDTIKLVCDNKKVICRLAYIDTPESRINRKTIRDSIDCNVNIYDMIEEGKKSTLFVKKILKKGKEVNVKFIGIGRYRRAICLIDNVNKLIVERGYGAVYERYAPKYWIEFEKPTKNYIIKCLRRIR